MKKYKYTNNQKIQFTYNSFTGTGLIKGIASDKGFPIGVEYIVELDNPIDGYEYPCITIHEQYIVEKE